MGKIKHNEAINIFQMILTFLMNIIGLCKKKDANANENDKENDPDDR